MQLRKRSRLFNNTYNKRKFNFILSIPNLLKKYWFKTIFVLLVCAVLIFSFKLFTIGEVECEADGQECPVELINLSLYLEGKNYFSLNKKQIFENISQIYPIDDLNYKYMWNKKIKLTIKGWNKTYDLAILSVPEYPLTSLDVSKVASESSSWSKPSLEIAEFLKDKNTSQGKLWANGQIIMESNLTPIATLLYVKNLDQEELANLYSLITLSQKYFTNYTIYISNYQFLLSQANRPDIIIYIPADTKRVETALQSIDYLYTINKDAKVIDLSFEHPIIK